jgi:hypothetical protein
MTFPLLGTGEFAFSDGGRREAAMPNLRTQLIAIKAQIVRGHY